MLVSILFTFRMIMMFQAGRCGGCGETMARAARHVGQDNRRGQGHVVMLMEEKLVWGTLLTPGTVTPFPVKVSSICPMNKHNTELQRTAPAPKDKGQFSTKNT